MLYPKVLILFSHDSQEHVNRVMQFSDNLLADGVFVDLDQFHMTPESGWENWLINQIESSDQVLLICAPILYHLLFSPDEHARILSCDFPERLSSDETFARLFYKDQIDLDKKFIPIGLDQTGIMCIPPVLKEKRYYNVSNKFEYEDLHNKLTNLYDVIGLPYGMPGTSKNTKDMRLIRKLSVFLCHASEDNEYVRNLYENLKQLGVSVWFDEKDMLAGLPWKQQIIDQMAKSHAIIVCLSQNAISKAGFFQKEVKFALENLAEQPKDSAYIIPTMLEQCPIPKKLEHIHYNRLYDDDGFDRLLFSLQYRARQISLINAT